jgi:glycosyltransferase involved in cell wall biosynthesis
MTPAVTFLVPCYKLGHLLKECVDSILTQTYTDLEVLILDDCSPDQTPEVARSFDDPRVHHVRNEPNLGHLANYNKGICMARGKYVWLISADDRLLRPDVLQKYVAVLDAHSSVGYVCSSAVEIRNGQYTSVVAYSAHKDRDTIYRGHQFLQKLLYSNSIVAASVMVRKSCYETLGVFPLDLPYAGDWYLWCLFSLHHDVAYVSDPSVAYRIHEHSMTETLVEQGAQVCVQDDLAVMWRIKESAEKAGSANIVCKSRQAIAYEYARQVLGKRYRSIVCQMTMHDCEESIGRFSTSANEAADITRRVFGSLGDLQAQRDNLNEALEAYRRALELRPAALTLWIKLFLLRAGNLGAHVRNGISFVRNIASN